MRHGLSLDELPQRQRANGEPPGETDAMGWGVKRMMLITADNHARSQTDFNQRSGFTVKPLRVGSSLLVRGEPDRVTATGQQAHADNGRGVHRALHDPDLRAGFDAFTVAVDPSGVRFVG